ncbi:MAG: hypothetical protein CMJ58_10080 [Planctomycetaceae bacterium]|nr:hypothetical protein [Planctomycetaceae bacterium]
MIRCLPVALCSWDYTLEGPSGIASLQFDWMTEQGSIDADGVEFEIRKHGYTSGRWTLEFEGEETASAQKTSVFSRTFDLRAGGESFVLQARSALGRTFQMLRGGRVVATFAPDHPFTRRARIEPTVDDVNLVTLAFAFWLVAVVWRRAARNSS